MSKIKLLDGAMGTVLIDNGEKLPQHTWSSPTNLSNPKLIYDIHSDYIRSGSQYITTNTFRTTTRAYKKTGLSYKEAKKLSKKSLLAAVSIAQKAAKKKIKVLGSIAPLEDCYKPKLFPNRDIARIEFKEIGCMLYKAQIDGFILETMNSIIETITCLEAIKDFNIPIWVSFNLKNKNKIKSGELIKDFIKAIECFPIESLLLNCNSVVKTIEGSKELIKYWKKSWGIYPNLGKGKPSPNGIIKDYSTDDELISTTREAIKMGATIIGGCCGTKPKHIRLLKKHFLVK